MKKISYSAWKKYMTCPKLYDLHYNSELRQVGTSSALVFGSAIDAALNAALMKTEDPIKAFHDAFKFENFKDVEWDRRDYDYDLFTFEQYQRIKGESQEYRAWASMRIKGRLMIEAYVDQILPKITKVYHVQKELIGRKGNIDAIVEFKGHGKVLVDHKTSARPYASDAVLTDPQLSLYAHSEGLTTAAFVVLIKEIQKNKVKTCVKCKFSSGHVRHKSCPEIFNGARCHGDFAETVNPAANIQLLIGKIPQISKDLVVESISETERAIDAKIFPRNLNSCGKMYGKPCPYINFCWNNDETMLQYTKSKEKK